MMPTYLISEPCVYTDADSGVTMHHREPGALVEISEETAEGLGTAVRRLGAGTQPETQEPESELESTSGPEPTPVAESESEAAPRGRRRGAADSPGNGDG